MKNFVKLIMAMSLIAMCSGVYAADQAVQPEHIKSVTALTEVFGEGQKLTAVAVEYDQAVENAKLATSTFMVAGRTITAVYANTAAEKAPAPVAQMAPPCSQTPQVLQGANGQFVIIELSPSDNGAALWVQSGRTSARLEAKVAVTQIGEVTTTDGATYAANPHALINDKVINLIVDDFQQREFKDPNTGITVKYNLFVPKNYDKTKSYPLVMFIHDAGVTSTDTEATLVQGLGAVIWATPAEQAKHECFVLAPQFSTQIVNDKFEAAADLDATVNLINALVGEYNIDTNRIYATGQSGGCMSSIVLNLKYPDLFAASFLVAGQWDPTVVAPLAKEKLWIVVSAGDVKAFPGMNAITAVMEKEGANVSREMWNGQSTATEFAFLVSKMVAKGNPINYTVFQRGTVVPAGMTDDGGSNHVCTWRIAYTIEGIRDWLFRQSK